MATKILALLALCATLAACGGGDAGPTAPDVPPYQIPVHMDAQPVDCSASSVCR